jgi:agmatine/peptidylarginine deiminase
MTIKPIFKKATPKESALYYKAKTKCDPPPNNELYHNDTPSPVSAIPEFAPMGGVLIAFPGTIPPPTNDSQQPPSGPRAFGIPNDLIVRMQQNDSIDPVHIFVMCDDLSQRENIIDDLQKTANQENLTFNPDNLHIVQWDTDTYWTRDYGPWWIQNKTSGHYGIVKHSYTTLGGGSVGLVEGAENVNPLEGLGIFRPNDDYGAVKFSDFLNGPIRAWNNASWTDGDGKKKLPQIDVHNWYYLGLLDVGGDYMVTGDGTLASSYLVATQNELPVHHEKETTDPCAKMVKERMEYILAQFNRFMGITKYHVSTDPTGTYIGHIDCWGKFLSNDTILIAESEDPKTNKAFDAIAESFKNDGFKIVRVMCQNIYVPVSSNATTAAYTNSLILNDHVYVPLAGKPYEKYDQKALLVYKEAMPNHTVVGIIGKKEFPWLGTDAMHCRTRGVPRDVVNNWLKSQMLKVG